MIKLLSGVKSLSQSLLSTQNVNVWNLYGSLNKATLQVERVMYHGLKSIQGDFGTQMDFWPFISGLKVVCPVTAPMIDRINRSGMSEKGQHWVRESLRDHTLSKHLEILVSSKEHLSRFYYDHAFLQDTQYFSAFLTCIKAIEQNKVSLLTDLDLSLLNDLPNEVATDSKPVVDVGRRATKAVNFRRSSRGHDDLAPAFASPPQHESLLVTSGEHALPAHMGYSESPESTKDMAKNALRSVLRKSGSESPPPDSQSFNFYDSTNCDPLGSFDMTIDVFQNKSDIVGSDKKVNEKGQKTPIIRSQSETGFRTSKTSEVIEQLFQEKENFDLGSESRVNLRRPEDIFSDSESTSPARKTNDKTKVKSKSVKGHKSSTVRRVIFPSQPRVSPSLTSCPLTTFQACATLDKENAHFSISEALIAAIEQMKWNHVISPHMPENIQEEEDSDEEIQRLKQKIRIRKREKLKEKARGFPAYSDGQTEITEDAMENQSNLSRLNSEGLNLSLASLYSAHQSSLILPSYLQNLWPLSLLKKFSEKQLPKASDLEWLVPETEVPQKLLPLPNCLPISPDDCEADMIKSKLRLRGNNEWAPPRSQIIFNIHPTPKQKVVVAKQNYMCAGCGTRVEPGYIKRFRYCEYLGKYFCQCCHSNQLSHIPAHILKKWDFKKYYVSNFSRDLICRIFNDPLFNIWDINPSLYRRVKALDSIAELRQQIMYLHKFLKICKFSGGLLTEITLLPSHWYESVHMYSLADLISVKANQMLNQLKNVVTNGLSHIDQCQFCQGFGFVCEFCNDDKDIIFPFQLQKVTVCPDCKSCFHKVCYVAGKCPKCARLEARLVYFKVFCKCRIIVQFVIL
ncbi:hypothetical protein FSP39_019904 [Pinctada imbricata]|uniref:RUN domain-containing protein n=1 Tax=Pinctada imbricata TaxID=66713 RepID=A0AA88Y045_PINIB|nr:hypothetical protein FSP39_019904 [Pinctada imbricata]